MIKIIKIIKGALIFLSICACIALLALSRVIFIFIPSKKVFIASYIVHILNKALTSILGIRITILGNKGLLKERGVFFVSNHLSYIDGIIASSLSPIVYIGKVDLKKWPFLGVLTSISYTIFVDRINPSNIHKELKNIISLLNSRVNVILFPEGTSGDGKRLLPFKSSFFAAPLEIGCKIVPIVIKYIKVNGVLLDNKNKDLVYWYGDMEFFGHLVNVMGLKSIDVEIEIADPLDVSRIKAEEPLIDRKDLSNASKQLIANCLNKGD